MISKVGSLDSILALNNSNNISWVFFVLHFIFLLPHNLSSLYFKAFSFCLRMIWSFNLPKDFKHTFPLNMFFWRKWQVKCSQTDCFSSEKEKRNLNHREKWFLGKKKREIGKWLLGSSKISYKKNKDRTEVLQIWLKDGKIYFPFPFVCLSTFPLPKKLTYCYESVTVFLVLIEMICPAHSGVFPHDFQSEF